MHYDPNYKNQIFYQSSNSIGIAEAFQIAKRELAVAEYKTKMPKNSVWSHLRALFESARFLL